ncbi:RNA helicase aquarius [Caerostris extrusa]|uniref:RNA helicase aquarius n=1 Tax=Caerostris extrusa TaxID=172846 RepID=A0AAV4X049_CAEEX|nr:RNA helicase aquarius [Caerostris extrusa]
MASTVQKKETVPTVAQINADSITQLANKYWAPNRPDKLTSDPATISTDVINDIYANEIVASGGFSIRRESTYEIRQDIEDVVKRFQDLALTEVGEVMFEGWAQWLSPFTVKPKCPPGTSYDSKQPFIPQIGLTYVRGCEIEGMLGPTGKVIEEGPEPKPQMEGDTRTFRVWLDCNQYRLDMLNAVGGKEDVYETFNIIMRRKPKENNFKAVLETIRSLMNTDCVVPDWLQNIILGHRGILVLLIIQK